VTWTSHLVATLTVSASYLYPSLAMDGAGNLHVVYAAATAADQPIWLTSSTDKGVTWSTPLPLLRGASGFSPWVAADDAGHVAVAWYGSSNPKATTATKVDWYFYWARIEGATTATPTITAGKTTATPIYFGASAIPEFEQVRLDRDGRMHLGMSAYRKPKTGSATWAAYYQAESAAG
jgi:hypothetical protein